MTHPTSGTFADFLAAVATPDDHVTLQRRPRTAPGTAARWSLIIARADGTLWEVGASSLAELVRRALARAREES
jgi:hypothetical protein